MQAKYEECGRPVEWSNADTCENGHAMLSIAEIPLYFKPEAFRTTKAADPGYPLERAINVAGLISTQTKTFSEAVEFFFDLREQEVNCDYSRERATRREEYRSRRAVYKAIVASHAGALLPA